MIFVYLFLLPLAVLSDGSITTPIGENIGLFYEKLTDIKTFQSQWRLVTSLDVSRYIRHAPDVERHILEMNQLCNRHNLTKCLSKELGPRLIKKRENTVRYSNLIRSAIGDTSYFDTPSPRRSVPFGFIGTLSKVLFGTLSQEDADFYYQELNKVYADQREITELIANQTHVIKGEFSNTHARLVNLTKATSQMTRMMSKHSDALQETKGNLNRLLLETIIKDSVFEIERGLDDYSTNLLLLIDAILLAKQGILHPTILSPEQLLKSAQKIKQTVPFEFPLTPEELLTEQIEKVTTLNVIFMKGRILFELTIPLLEQKAYSLYKIYPCPSIHKLGTKEVISYIQPQIQFIAVSSDEQQFFTPTEEYLRTCRFHHNKFLGPATLPLYQADRQSTCESILLLNPTLINWNTCEIKVTKFVKPYWQTLSAPATWLYFMPKGKKAQIYCSSEKPVTRNISAIGIFKLEPGCQATIDSVQLKSLGTIGTTQNVEYYPSEPYNLSIIVPEIVERHFEALEVNEQITARWDDLPAASSLTEIEHRARILATHQASFQNLKITTSSSIGIVMLIVVMLTILLARKNKTFQNCSRKEHPKESTELTINIPGASNSSNEIKNLKPSATIF